MSVPFPLMGEKGGLKLHKGMHGVDEVDQAGVNMVVVGGGGREGKIWRSSRLAV